MSEIRGRLFAEKKKLLLICGAVALVIAVAAASFFAWQYFNDPARSNSDTAERIVNDVAKLYDLPTDEQPSVAQLQDPAGLQGQEFYQKAQKGDYVLVYRKAKLALIYRESAKKLINVDHVETEKP